MKDIVFTLEFDDDWANKRTNDYLKKGWKLLHVGTKLIDTTDDGHPYYNTVYVVGANQEQYEAYKEEESKDTLLETLIKKSERNS